MGRAAYPLGFEVGAPISEGPGFADFFSGVVGSTQNHAFRWAFPWRTGALARAAGRASLLAGLASCFGLRETAGGASKRPPNTQSR